VIARIWHGVTGIEAGDDIQRARYYPEDQGYLLEYEPTVAHYELYGEAGR